MGLYDPDDIRAHVMRLEQTASDLFSGPNHVLNGAWVKGKAMVSSRQELGKVYFKRGHATIDHIKPRNVGWEAPLGRCIFFGNIPHGWLKQVFP